jgi:hypothetical protein
VLSLLQRQQVKACRVSVQARALESTGEEEGGGGRDGGRRTGTGIGQAYLLLAAFGRFVDAQIDSDIAEGRFDEYRHGLKGGQQARAPSNRLQ